MRKLLLVLFAFAAMVSTARADFTGKDAALATITFKNASGACTSVVCVPQAAITDSTGSLYVAMPTAGADAQSNTANGLLVYNRMLIFNGTTWDRWQGAITAASLPLPAGASTAANQTTGNTSLASIVTNTTSLGSVSSTGTAWTSATGGNTTQTLMTVGQGSPALLVQLNQTTTLTAGAVTFEGTYDNTNWVSIPVAQLLNPSTFAPLTNPYTLVASTNQPFLVLTQGYQSVRLRLSTVITGTATVTPFVTLLPNNPTVAALLNPLAPGSNIIGKVGIDQTTPGTTNSVSFGTDPCTFIAKTNVAISQVTGTQWIVGTSAKKTYVCSIMVIAAAGETINLVEGTGSVCATGIAAIIGSATTASGLAVAANGGLVLGNGSASVAIAGNAAADNVCITQVGASRISGNLTYVQN